MERRARILIGQRLSQDTEVLAECLRACRHQVDAVSDGLSVLEAVERRQPDLVVIDLDLPELDGLTVLEALSRAPTRNMPIVVAADSADSDLVERLVELGASAVLLGSSALVEWVERNHDVLATRRSTSTLGMDGSRRHLDPIVPII